MRAVWLGGTAHLNIKISLFSLTFDTDRRNRLVAGTEGETGTGSAGLLWLASATLNNNYIY